MTATFRCAFPRTRAPHARPHSENVGGSDLTFKRLFLVSPPAHGKIRLREGGHYIYSTPSGYKGPDAFTLRVCGTEDNEPGCATLKYSVTID
jgi:hypothetical protein